MTKLIKHKDARSAYIELKPNVYEKYFKLDNAERRKFLRFAAATLVTTITAIISLLYLYKEYLHYLLLAGGLVWLTSIAIYFLFYKKPDNGISFGRIG